MNKSKHSDIEIEILLLGKWRFGTSTEKIMIEFKDDMTYRQTRVQMLFFSKPKELITGNTFTGIWYVSRKKLHLDVRTMPKSFFNLEIPLGLKISLADIVATSFSIFMPESYEVFRINRSQFLIKDKEELIVGTKI